MTVAAVMLVRDEADIIETTVRHLLGQVDEVIVTDHRSTDGTREILAGLSVELIRDDEPGIWQERKTNAMAELAAERGHSWVVPCDADELWNVDEGARLGHFLEQQRPEVGIATARMFNYVPTAVDGDDPNPVLRMGWRERECNSVKVAARLGRGLVIEEGHHNAKHSPPMRRVHGLHICHYTLRSEAHAILKVRNGLDSYGTATGMPEGHDHAWVLWGTTDDEIADRYQSEFHVANPYADRSLIYDPVSL